MEAIKVERASDSEEGSSSNFFNDFSGNNSPEFGVAPSRDPSPAYAGPLPAYIRYPIFPPDTRVALNTHKATVYGANKFARYCAAKGVNPYFEGLTEPELNTALAAFYTDLASAEQPVTPYTLSGLRSAIHRYLSQACKKATNIIASPVFHDANKAYNEALTTIRNFYNISKFQRRPVKRKYHDGYPTMVSPYQNRIHTYIEPQYLEQPLEQNYPTIPPPDLTRCPAPPKQLALPPPPSPVPIFSGYVPHMLGRQPGASKSQEVQMSRQNTAREQHKGLGRPIVSDFSSNSMENSFTPCPAEVCTDVGSNDYDALVLVTPVLELTGELATLKADLEQYLKLDQSADSGAHLILTKNVPSGRLIYAPTGPVSRDIDDIRRYAEAAAAGVRRAVSSGAVKPLLVLVGHERYEHADLVGLLGAFQELYVPCEAKKDGIICKAEKIGFYAQDAANSSAVLELARALEAGRTVTRDIYASDPVFMGPPGAAKYVVGMLDNSEDVDVTVISDKEQIAKEYPTVEAVGRGCEDIAHFQSRVVKLSYTGEGTIKETLMMVGKGITFDTGGTDLKVGGVMRGMRCDKGGAAVIAGLFKILSILRPPHLKVVATLPFVRNAIGPQAYTCDEIIKARSGKRLRIINTDAEGRMIMCDPLCEMREMASAEVNPHLYTIATLTGHALLAVGNYPILIDNGPAKSEKSAQAMVEAGEKLGDMIEMSTLRREDFDAVKNKTCYADILHSPPGASSKTMRGHQIPMAFLMEATGLAEHGSESGSPLKYSHIDMAGVPFEPMPHASPLLAFAAKYVLPNLKR